MKTVIVMLSRKEPLERLSEIKSLCKTAGYEVLDTFLQKGRASRKYLIREGKVKEIREFVSQNPLDLIVFENPLSSSQSLALEDAIGVPVIDRFDIILNVFELHALNREAQLQIELARLKKRLPYLKMYLSRKVREEHPGFGGSGEFIVHSTINSIHRRIKFIEDNLDKFMKRTEQQRKRRKKFGKVVSIVGYTNVGKTSLLNALTNAGKPAKDELFTTLQTKTGAYSQNGERFLVNDTIGFIRNLPHHLIYAFRATLMDISSSDLILIVHDSSLPKKELLRRQEICEDTLIGIGAASAKWLNVENKIDIGKSRLQGAISVSAFTGQGIEKLKNEIKGVFSHGE